MKSISEKEHAKNIANANLFNTYVLQLGDIYNPSNSDIELKNLQIIYTTAVADQQALNSALPPYTLAVNNRKAVFAPVSRKVTKLRKAYKATKGVTQAQLEDFMTIARRLKGLRKSQPAQPNPGEVQTLNSVSQMSYDQRTSNYGLLVDLLQATPEYAPNETEFQIASLQGEKEQMKQATQAVADTIVPVNKTRTTRDKIVYTSPNNLVDTYNTAKDYIFIILDSNSPLYKAISKIKFKKP